MEFYRVKWRKTTKKDLRRIPPREVLKIVEAVEALAFDPKPHGSIKMQGSDCAYRLRIGDYRVVYEVYEHTVIIEIIRVRHRRDVYRKR
jgi:mRNA interferase RelE/StbE